MLGDLGDPVAAREFMERSLLPATQHARLPEMTIPIRAQYAVVCAHCGDHVRAGEVMDALAPYAEGLPRDGRAELENQRELVAQLRTRGALSANDVEARRQRIEAQEEHAQRLRAALALGPSPQSTSRPPGKVGRNKPCPCGSDRKFKKCCGASS